MKHFFIIIYCIVIQFQIANAQSTKIYNDKDEQYKIAITQYNQGLYKIAQENFSEYSQLPVDVHNAQALVYKKNAHYFIALISLQLLQPDFEKKVNDFTNTYLPDPRAFELTLKLANYYFENKKFDKAAEIYESLDENLLDNAQSTEYKFKKSYLYYSKNEFSKAKEGFKTLTTFDNPYKYDAYYYSGIIALKENNEDKALEYFEKSATDEKYKKEIPKFIAQIHFNKKRFDEVIQYTEPKMTENVNDNESLGMLLGLSYYEKKQYSKALPLLETYISKSHKITPQLMYTVGVLQYKTEKFENAIENFKTLSINNDSLSQSAMYFLAESYLKTNNKKLAINAFKGASQLNFDAILQQKAHFNYAKLLYELGNDGEALTSLQNYNLKYPKSDETLETKEIISSILVNSNNYPKAIETLESMPKLSPSMKKAYQRVTYLNAVDLYKNGDTKSAISYFDKSLQYPNNPKLQSLAYFWKGKIYQDNSKFNEAAENYGLYISNFSSKEIYPDESSLMTANYNMGYSQIELNKSNLAQKYFEKALEKNNTIEDNNLRERLSADINTRLGDLNFMQKNYQSAYEKYNNALIPLNKEYDYALYQKSILAGLLNNTEEKYNSLNTFINQFPSSPYADDAVLQLGNTNFEKGEYSQAENFYQKLIKNYPKSSLLKEMYLKMGLLKYNTNKNDEAITYYKKVVEKYPNSNEANEALLALKDVYIEKGNGKAYIEYVSKIKGNFSTNAQDTLVYQIAEKQFMNGNYTEAKTNFNDYLNQFPKGRFVSNAYFYRAECNYINDNQTEALPDYEKVIVSNNDLFIEKSYGRAAVLQMKNKNYVLANEYFQGLYDNASNFESKIDALKGLMRTSFYLKKYDKSEFFAQELEKEKNNDATIENEINYIKAKSAIEQNKWNEALPFLEKMKHDNNENAAESLYYIAYIQFKQNDLISSKETIMHLANDMPNYEHWIIKGFILMSDIFVDEKDYFQAKQTLKSVIENSNDNTLKSEAEIKLKKVEQLELENSKLENHE